MSESSTPAAQSGSSGAERAEVERLRARVAELEARLSRPAAAAPVARGPRQRWRSVTAAVLITVGCLLSPLAVTAVWAHQEISNTDRYVQTVSPLASDPAVQRAVTNRITTAIFERVDVNALVGDAVSRLQAQGLPPQVSGALGALSAPITNGVEGFTRDQVAKIVASPQFAQAWDAANRAAHTQVVNVLSGNQSGAVTAQGNAVVVDLGPFVEQVKTRLVDEGFGLAANIPAVNASVTLFQSDQLPRVQGAYRLLEALGLWLPVISLVLIGAGVYVAKSHRRALLGGALGVAGGMLLLGLALTWGRSAYLGALPSGVDTQAATSLFDTLVRFLRDALRATLVAALVVAALAFFAGGSVTATRTRGALTGGIGSVRRGAEGRGMRTGRVGGWLYAHRRAARITIAAVAAAVIVFWTNPTVVVVLWTAVVALVVLAVLEFLARPPGEQPEPAPEEAAREEQPPAVPRQAGGVDREPGRSGSEPRQPQ